MASGPSGFWSPPYAGSPGGDAALSTAESSAQGNAGVPIAGGRYLGTGGHLKGVPDTLPYPTDAYGKSGPPLAKDNASFASGVSAGTQAEPHPARTRLSEGESAGARLTVSPSMKMPEQSPVPTQATGRVVPSTPSRQGSFSQGQAGAYGG